VLLVIIFIKRSAKLATKAVRRATVHQIASHVNLACTCLKEIALLSARIELMVDLVFAQLAWMIVQPAKMATLV